MLIYRGNGVVVMAIELVWSLFVFLGLCQSRSGVYQLRLLLLAHHHEKKGF